MRFKIHFMLIPLMCAAASHAASLHYWVEPCPRAAALCQAGDPELAGWAMEAWQTASGSRLKLIKSTDREHAQIRVLWIDGRAGLYGETRGGDVYVSTPAASSDDALSRDAVVYLTCVHEIGHALGLAHTADFADIMYSFQYGGDIPEYFGRYRRQLSVRTDIRKHSGMSPDDRKRLLELYP